MHPRLCALEALRLADPEAKVAATRHLAARCLDEPMPDVSLAGGCFQGGTAKDPPGVPGRPEKPLRIDAMAIGRRSPFMHEGRAGLIHAICHIEFNAINLALDAMWRFDGMPEAYYRDWLRVADEEAQHFAMLHAHLRTMGFSYGDFLAHDGLWTMCEKTAHDVLARMALVPRTLEARGLDATPQIQAKLARVNTPDALAASAILDVILRDEVGHIAVGNRWYRWLCERQGLDPVAHYRVLYRRHEAPRLRPPFNIEARSRAGFTPEELAELQSDRS